MQHAGQFPLCAPEGVWAANPCLQPPLSIRAKENERGRRLLTQSNSKHPSHKPLLRRWPPECSYLVSLSHLTSLPGSQSLSAWISSQFSGVQVKPSSLGTRTHTVPFIATV